jgi:hypothetical protein
MIKDQTPLKMMFWQSDIEKIMYQINKAIEGNPDKEQLTRIKTNLQHKIDWHKEHEEWV